jgi:hypothetical protein
MNHRQDFIQPVHRVIVASVSEIETRFVDKVTPFVALESATIYSR